MVCLLRSIFINGCSVFEQGSFQTDSFKYLFKVFAQKRLNIQ
jgi:hypothetical protein